MAVTEDNWKAHNFLGSACYKAGRLEGAIVNFRAVLRLKPGYIDAMNNLGTALLEQGKHEEALELLARAAADVGNAGAHYSYANALEAAGRLDEAADHFSRALGLGPDPPSSRPAYA